MRKTYIENNDIARFADYLTDLGAIETREEMILTENALGRVTSRAIFAKCCDPMFNASAMDGIACLAERTFDACEKTPLILTQDADFVYANTGNAIDPRFDAVVMIEDVGVLADGKVSIIAPAYPWQHVRVKGESIVEGELILSSNRKIRPVDIGAIFASGNERIFVRAKPIVGILVSGDEMVDSPKELESGKLLESNSRMFKALIEENGGVAKRYPIVKDDKEMLKSTLIQALAETDAVIVNAGSSAGTKDFALSAIEEIGKVFLHGFALKPGKPTILATAHGKPVIGIPGYPVSAYLVFELFMKPVMKAMLGTDSGDKQTVKARLTRNVVSSLKNTEYVRMSVGKVNGRLVATPLERGAAQIMSLVKADGLMLIDRYSEGIAEGTEVEIELRKPLSLIEKNIVIIGSHDLIIDVIGAKLPVSSAHVGSMGGVLAMQKGECHIAPIHLLDVESGIYNIPFVKKYFPNEKMALIKGVGRTQGLIVPKGNPKHIQSIRDLTEKVCFANRQRGSGTRILFDFLLKQIGREETSIKGYEKEYSTHLAVGTAVECGACDVGLGVGSAANCLNLDFVPLYEEEYDFLVRADSLSEKRIEDFCANIVSKDFKNKLTFFDDYTFNRIGEIVIV